MQPGGRGRDRAARASEDGLIAIAVVGAVVALDVRRQRHVADRIDGRVDAECRPRSRAARAAGRRNGVRGSRRAGCAFLQRPPALPASISAPGAPAPPRLRVVGSGSDVPVCPPCLRCPAPADQQALDPPPLGTRRPSRRAGNTRVLLTTRRSPARSRSGSAATRGVVSDPLSRSRTSRRDAPRSGGRLLRDQIRRKVEVEVADVHARDRHVSARRLTGMRSADVREMSTASG